MSGFRALGKLAERLGCGTSGGSIVADASKSTQDVREGGPRPVDLAHGVLEYREIPADTELSRGWDGAGFPSFELPGPRVLYCLNTGCTGGNGYMIIAKTSEEAKHILFDVHRVLHPVDAPAGYDEALAAQLFGPPNGWHVDVLAQEPRFLGAWIGGFRCRPAACTVRELAKLAGPALNRGCEECGYRLPTESTLITLEYEDSSIGDSFVWVCDRCGHGNFLTDDNF